MPKLNRENIDRMSGDELEATIADRKGWRQEFGFMDSASRFKQNYWIMPDGIVTSVLPSWSTEVSVAWELVDEMVNAPGVINVQTEYHTDGNYSECYYREYPTGDAELVMGHAFTAPIAICLAYLAWKKDIK